MIILPWSSENLERDQLTVVPTLPNLSRPGDTLGVITFLRDILELT